MPETWDPDVPLDLQRAHEIVAAQFAEYRTSTPEFLGEGWDNLCIRYLDRMVFRLPRRKLGANLLQNEHAALPFLAPHLPIPVPQFQKLGSPTKHYPYAFAGYPYLEGQT